MRRSISNRQNYFDDAYRKYLAHFGNEPGEILQLFGNFEPVYHSEGPDPVHEHGGEPERDTEVSAIFRKK
jgi:hypothetical protein